MGMRLFLVGRPPAKFSGSVTWSVNLVNVVVLAVRCVLCPVSLQIDKVLLCYTFRLPT